jgi:hypothetical protein
MYVTYMYVYTYKIHSHYIYIPYPTEGGTHTYVHLYIYLFIYVYQKTEDLRIVREDNDALKLSLTSAEENNQCHIKELKSSLYRINELEYLREHLQSSFDQACSDCERYICDVLYLCRDIYSCAV